jgi:hypothetical protein
MNTNSTLNNAMFNFAFTGVMQPHRRPEEERLPSLFSRLIPKGKPVGH